MSTKIWMILAALSASVPSLAAPISDTGSSIEVESYRCSVKSSRIIECTNIGRVCEEARAKQKKQDDYYFGCALDDWKAKHPGEICLPIEKTYFAPPECLTEQLGGIG